MTYIVEIINSSYKVRFEGFLVVFDEIGVITI